MYVPPAFKAGPEAACELLHERGFGTLVAFDGTRPVAAHVPFLFVPSAPHGRVELHVARANPIHEVIARNPGILLACTGPDAYVSPDWYASANQVPTWNYVAAQVTGAAHLMAKDELLAHVDRLSAHFEERLPKKPWTTAKMDPQRLDAMLNAIVGIVVKVETIDASWKLGQHKSRGDHDGAVAGLRAQGDAGSARVADLMDGVRGIDR
jgi:transcriptional regulator